MQTWRFGNIFLKVWICTKNIKSSNVRSLSLLIGLLEVVRVTLEIDNNNVISISRRYLYVFPSKGQVRTLGYRGQHGL